MVSAPISTAASTTETQNFQEFLSNVLSKCGPSSLPYTEDVKWVIRQHLLALIDIYPSLQLKTSAFTHNDGRTVNLLHAQGTVPMSYQNVIYYIPVIIWLMESYPRHRPCVYVTPTPDMTIKRPHPHVNPSGLVSHAYLHNWIYPSSNLVDLVCNLSHIFSKDPPLYTRDQTQKPNLRSSSLPSTVPSYSSSPQHSEDLEEVYRKKAIDKLMEKLQVDAEGLKNATTGDVEELFDLQEVLRHRDELLSKEMRKLEEEKESLEQELQMVLMNTDLLESWLRENEKRVRKTRTVEVEEIFEPCDRISRQMLECSAADLAIEDAIYSLDKAVQEGSVPFDQYLRNIRMLSREQFIHRATATKAARGSQYL
ncbi:hypothetical protein NE237_016789 [Protea cynaroides]|uniref:Protein ELC-like n=1 Tax=Protea cynaroides TaxID=273540 RepID=A0A9Q0K6Y3_9MAGN|nr:hypothetical protein NE237_016789 [Protea cynaroides]